MSQTVMLKHALILSIGVLAINSVAGDARLKPPIDLNTHRDFPKIESREQWPQRADFIREHARAVTGLLPMPVKMPLNAKVFDRVERDGYSIEKVHLETHPGFYLAGNLYRPLGKGDGPFPGVLNPHGHWANGRMADVESGSLAGRCISQARLGMIAFTYDMVGYNDTRQVDHKFAGNPTNQLWNISLMGLQTWNSIRALDFLESLPDVDKSRLSCTGESGGGTQTFMLGAVDNRLAAQAPIVMVSHSMQGGCLCENAPGLRIDHSNMEIAAAVAPRPQIIVSATGDWTKDTMSIEGPGIASVYKLLGAPEKFRYAIFDYEHNYNKTTREAVYAFLSQYLLNQTEANRIPEPPFKKEPDSDLRVFPDKLPPNALDEPQLITWLVNQYKSQLAQSVPYDEASFKQWHDLVTRQWKHALLAETTTNFTSVNESVLRKSVSLKTPFGSKESGLSVRSVQLGRKDHGDSIPVTLLEPARESETVAILLHPEGRSVYYQKEGKPESTAADLLSQGVAVVVLDLFMTGSQKDDALRQKREYTKNYFTVYNRTDAQERVQDIVTAASWVRSLKPKAKIALVGEGRAGLWAMLAAPVADILIADCSQFDDSTDEAVMAQDLFFPGFRRVGGLQTLAALAAPKPVVLHNINPNFDIGTLRSVYTSANAQKNLQLRPDKLPRIALQKL